MNFNRAALILIFLAAFGAMFSYTRELAQKNPESIFLTDEGMEKFEKFQEDFPEVESLVIYSHGMPTVNTYEDLEVFGKKLEEACDDECYFLYPHELVRKRQDYLDRLKERDFKSLELTSSESVGFIVFNKGEKGQLKNIVREVEKQVRFHCAGHDYTNYQLDKSSEVVQEKIFPFLFAFSLFLLFVFIRNIVDSILLFFPCVLSSILSLSVIKYFFHHMNMVNSIVPLMTFVITLSLGQHLYFTARDMGSLKLALKVKLKPIVLMLITTFIGFLSLYISEIFVIRSFGLLSSFLILISSILAIIWLISVEGLLHYRRDREYKLRLYPKKSLSFFGIISLVVIALLAGIWGGNNVKVITDATKYFPKESDIHASFEEVTKLAGGVPIVEIGINTKDYESLKHILKLENELKEVTGLKVFSRNQMIQRINKDYSGSLSIPENRFAYTTLYSKAPEALREAYSIDGEYKITLLGAPLNVDKYESLIKKVHQILKGQNYTIDGLYYNLMISQKEMVHTLSKSFLISLIIMALIAVITLKELKLFIIFILVNTLPLGLSLGFLNLSDMSLNIATVMTYSVGLGIVVDSTFHILHYLGSHKFSMEEYLETIVKPVLTSSITLIVAFLLFGAYDFLPIKEFGLNLSFILLCGMIFDLFVLPTLYLGRSDFNTGGSHDL
ncbi:MULTISPECIES: hypothetical protein [Halobacteriovorax]|uniref:Membrane transport protein MMPL domain-containing protein n=1 Tax=Halobacteriovorax vibrionivorans TaxID=2152716 RepID=A0ABY0IJD3_9BACT|nr:MULTISPECIES: hypothetical protein [Halobacteriovorax]RZF21442.1 hypothetical protein DAY19_07080 [Halobacteriovorax vibrionivorans]TGD48715.1 hypothetical protein EP118_02555 [Halobacteriovorax sp. Y22]